MFCCGRGDGEMADEVTEVCFLVVVSECGGGW